MVWYNTTLTLSLKRTIFVSYSNLVWYNILPYAMSKDLVFVSYSNLVWYNVGEEVTLLT